MTFGKDWKWIFINLIPILGWIIWFIWLGFGKSGNGNQNLFKIKFSLENLNLSDIELIFHLNNLFFLNLFDFLNFIRMH